MGVLLPKSNACSNRVISNKFDSKIRDKCQEKFIDFNKVDD